MHLTVNTLQWCICVSGFLDLFGVSIIYPLLIYHAKSLGATPSQVGLFGSIYGTLQFFTSPIMGQLSDHVGRRVVLLISLFGTGSAYFLLGIADTIVLLAVSRIPSGIFKHSQSMSRTLLADISPAHEKAKMFGMFNSMSSLGFIIGPTIGGILSTTKNGFFKVAMLSSFIFFFNFLFVYLVIRSSHNTSNDELKSNDEKKKLNLLSCLNAFRDVRYIPWKRIWNPFTVRFLLSFSMILFRANFTSVLVYRFATDPRTNGFILSFNGILSALTGIGVKWISTWFHSNSSMHNTFSIVMVLSLIAITLAPSLFAVILSLIPLCFASSVLRVTNAIAIYNKGDQKVRGLLNGFGDTLTSLARALGPAIAGYAQEASIYGPGVCGTILAVFGTAVGFSSTDTDYKFHAE